MNIFSSLLEPNPTKLYQKRDLDGLTRALGYGNDPQVRVDSAAGRFRSRVVEVRLYDPNVGVGGIDWRCAFQSRPSIDAPKRRLSW